MLQIINISEARENLSDLVKQVSRTKKPVIIIRDSIPSVILYPYQEVDEGNSSSYQEKLLSIKGDWFSIKEYKKMRKQVKERLKKTT